jgi:putative Holliday junction resolvase
LTDPAGRVLCIDLGRVRVGLAVSDPLRVTAQPAGFLARRELARSLTPLGDLAAAREVSTIVVGHPLLLSGERGAAAEEAEQFAARVRDELGRPVHLWDERLTTAQATRALIEGGVRRGRRREVVDAAAATLILQSWLDARR